VFITSTNEFPLHGAGEWLKSRPGSFTPKKRTPSNFWTEGWASLNRIGRVKKITLTSPAVERRSFDFPGRGLSGMPAELSLFLACGLGSKSNAVHADLRVDRLVFPLMREVRLPENSEVIPTLLVTLPSQHFALLILLMVVMKA
jgi:hypothetical protein